MIKNQMSKWYKKAQLGKNLVFVIATYLRNAKNNPQLANVNDDITNQMEGADDVGSLSSSISLAVNMVSSEQGGYLTPSQQELISHIQTRNQNFSDPLETPEISENNQVGNFEQLDNQIDQMPQF